MTQKHSLLYLGLCGVFSLSSCVTNDPPPPVNVGDMSYVDMPSDMQAGDADQSTIMDMPAPLDADMSVVDMPEDLGPPQICTPHIRECVTEELARACQDDGLAWEEESCGEDEECEAGSCVKAPICEEGTATCLDSSSRQVCRPGGLMFAVESCAEGTTCIQGECTSGELNGTVCSEHDDCAGGKCHCGDMTGEGCSDVFTTPAYCTSTCQTNDDCAQSEVCFNSDVHLITGQASNYNHCVPKCQGVCASDDYTCKILPVIDSQGNQVWEEGCYFKGVKQIGEECEADVECLGGYCLKDYFSTGYCSTRCEASTCPGNSSCVQLIEGEYWCTLKCGDGISSSGSCPLDEPTDRLDVTCAYRQARDGNNARVCVSTSQ